MSRIIPSFVVLCAVALGKDSESCEELAHDPSATETSLLQIRENGKIRENGTGWDVCTVSFFHIENCVLGDGSANFAALPIRTQNSHEYKRMVKLESGQKRWKINRTLEEDSYFHPDPVKDDDYGKDNWVKSVKLSPGCKEVELYDEDKGKRGYEDNLHIQPRATDERNVVTEVNVWSEWLGTISSGPCVNLPNDLEEDINGVYVTVYDGRSPDLTPRRRVLGPIHDYHRRRVDPCWFPINGECKELP